LPDTTTLKMELISLRLSPKTVFLSSEKYATKKCSCRRSAILLNTFF